MTTTETRERFRTAADDAIASVARTQPTLTIDDVREALVPDEAFEVIDLRALGGRMLAAKRSGMIEPTDRHVLSRRERCHHRPLRVWESRVAPGRHIS